VFAHGRWFSLGTLASSTTKTGRHYIAEILLKVAESGIKTHTQKNKQTILSQILFLYNLGKN
jgi:hypothetical protein